MRASFFTNRAFCAPIVLLSGVSCLLTLSVPLLLSALCLALPVRLGRIRLYPIVLFLAYVFYVQYAVATFFDGIEDYRHSLQGTHALVLLPWLCALAGRREQRRLPQQRRGRPRAQACEATE